MSNTYFQFKQFTVHQADAAMKVGTDGVLLGAWADFNNAKRILDIGTGTGLLSLMAAQLNSQAIIDAVEVDEAAYRQAEINAKSSSWSERINIIHKSFQQYAKESLFLYDVIISNPPYFNNSLKSPKEQRCLARHTDDLPYIDLIIGAKLILQAKGRFLLILPTNEAELFVKLALQNGLYCSKKLNVKPNSNKPIKRILFEFINKPTTTNEQTLCIETGERHNYTKEYKQLTADFYLKF